MMQFVQVASSFAFAKQKKHPFRAGIKQFRRTNRFGHLAALLKCSCQHDTGTRETVDFNGFPGAFLLRFQLYAATAFALTWSMILRMPIQTLRSVKTSTMLPWSVKGASCRTERSFIMPL